MLIYVPCEFGVSSVPPSDYLRMELLQGDWLLASSDTQWRSSSCRTEDFLRGTGPHSPHRDLGGFGPASALMGTAVLGLSLLLPPSFLVLEKGRASLSRVAAWGQTNKWKSVIDTDPIFDWNFDFFCFIILYCFCYLLLSFLLLLLSYWIIEFFGTLLNFALEASAWLISPWSQPWRTG